MDKWHQFVDGEVIIKQGFVNKRKGLFARKRMLLLTTGPRLIYVDPVQMVKKGEIPWSAELKTETKSFKIFFVHTVSILMSLYIYLSVNYALSIFDIMQSNDHWFSLVAQRFQFKFLSNEISQYSLRHQFCD